MFITDNGNHILDCHVQPIERPAALDEAIRNIPGVVTTGLFLKMAHTVLIQHSETLEVRSAPSRIEKPDLTIVGQDGGLPS